MRAIAVTRPGRVEIVEVPRPEPGDYQALVRTELACLCNATDSKLVAGHFPGIDRYPLLLGHESAGVVERVGAKVRGFRRGDRVIGGLVFECGDARYGSGWGGFCEYTLANDHDAMVQDGVADADHGWFEVYEVQRPVDADIGLEAAALLCTWREVYSAFADFHLRPGDDAVIFGGGPVGLSFVRLGRLFGLGFVGLVDPHAAKQDRALAMGADAVFAPDDPELTRTVRGRGRPLDIVIDAVGRPSVVRQALPMIKMGGSIGVYGVLSDASFVVEKAAGPYNFNLYLHQWPTRSGERAAQGPLCDWIRAGTLDAAEFVTHRFPMQEVAAGLAALTTGTATKVTLGYGH
jgi:threonine dehydrogenase-like Zn-dependent dehydrogenase